MGFCPQIHTPNRPRTLQQDFAAVPIVRKQPGDGVGRSFLGVAQDSCAVWGTGGSLTKSPTEQTQDSRGMLLDQPCPSSE